MWNPFRMRSLEAIRIERRLAELEDELGKAVRLLEKFDARYRGRDSRARVDQPEVLPADAAAPPGKVGSGSGSGPTGATHLEIPRVVPRAELRERAKAKGYIA